MKRLYVSLSILILFSAIFLITCGGILPSPNATKICLYPQVSDAGEITLEQLQKMTSICFEDEKNLEAINSAKGYLFKFEMWQGSINGVFQDKNKKPHLIKVSLSSSSFIDISKHKTYVIKDPRMQKRWFSMIDSALSQNSKMK